MALAAVVVGSAGAGATASPVARAPLSDSAAASYYVLLLTNVEDNVYVGTEASLQGVNACDLPDGGPSPCSNPVTYTVELGPYATCAAATAAYNAAAMNPHPAFGGTKVYIFGGSYFIDDMGFWCTPGSTTTTTSTTTTPTTTTTTTTTTTSGQPTVSLPPLAKSFCKANAHTAAEPPAPCAPDKAVSAAEKAQARAFLHTLLFLTVLACGASPDVDQSTGQKLNLTVAMFVSLCPRMIDMMGEGLVVIHDPTAAGYQQVALLAVGAAPALAGACPNAASAAACTALQAAAGKYAGAAIVTAAVTAAESLTLDRFAAAVAAHSVSGAFLQAALAKVYGGALDAELITLHADGQALATAYGQAGGGEISVSASSAKQAIKQPGGTVLTSAVLAQLVAAGVAPTPALARQAIVGQLGNVSGTLDSNTTLGGSLPASDFASPYFTLTLSDLEAIVMGLAAQSSVSSAASGALSGDLAVARRACGVTSRFNAAIDRFTSFTNANLKGAVADVLVFAARPLTESGVTNANCA